MWEILSLPAKYRVNKELKASDFLSKANLTKTEADELSLVISNIELKYDVRFSDKTEIIFIDVSIKYQKNKWTSKNVARAVAQSIPYDCIIYIHDNSMGCVSAFIRRENESNSRRSAIDKQSVIPEFQIGDLPDETKKCLTDICNIVSDEDLTASLVSLRCIERIEACKNYYSLFGEMIEEEKQENHRIMRLLQYGVSGDSFDEDFASDNDSSDNEIVVSMSEEALCKSAYAFFCDSDSYNEDDDVPEWLLDYAKNCKDILDDLYNVEPGSEFYCQLGSSFSHQDRDDADEYEDDPAVQLMKERISEGDF